MLVHVELGKQTPLFDEALVVPIDEVCGAPFGMKKNLSMHIEVIMGDRFQSAEVFDSCCKVKGVWAIQ